MVTEIKKMLNKGRDIRSLIPGWGGQVISVNSSGIVILTMNGKKRTMSLNKGLVIKHLTKNKCVVKEEE